MFAFIMNQNSPRESEVGNEYSQEQTPVDSIIDSISKNDDSRSNDPYSFENTPNETPRANHRDLAPAEAILRKLELTTGKRMHS